MLPVVTPVRGKKPAGSAYNQIKMGTKKWNREADGKYRHVPSNKLYWRPWVEGKRNRGPDISFALSRAPAHQSTPPPCAAPCPSRRPDTPQLSPHSTTRCLQSCLHYKTSEPRPRFGDARYQSLSRRWWAGLSKFQKGREEVLRDAIPRIMELGDGRDSDWKKGATTDFFRVLNYLR